MITESMDEKKKKKSESFTVKAFGIIKPTSSAGMIREKTNKEEKLQL